MRDTANKWTTEGPVMGCILRILYKVCTAREVRVWMLHVSPEYEGIADGLSRSLDFKNSSPGLRRSREVGPPEDLDSWMTIIINTTQSKAARAYKNDTSQSGNGDQTENDAHTNNCDRMVIE